MLLVMVVGIELFSIIIIFVVKFLMYKNHKYHINIIYNYPLTVPMFINKIIKKIIIKYEITTIQYIY